MLTDRITVIQAVTGEPTPEDHFAASLSTIFTDDLCNQHGDADATIVYRSPALGEIKLTLADPSEEDSRRLFAHYLWNAGVWTATRIEDASHAPVNMSTASNSDVGEALWSVRGERVLELGAGEPPMLGCIVAVVLREWLGLGLGGIVSSLVGALRTVITDYPAPEVLQNIQKNVVANIGPAQLESISVEGHEWGVFPAAERSEEKLSKGSFTRIFAADCLWMPWQHHNLARSMFYYLSDAPQSRVFVVAGFHTGRAKVAQFFDIIEEEGLEVEDIHEEDVNGVKREWAKERDGGREDVTGRKRWLVIAVLRRTRGN